MRSGFDWRGRRVLLTGHTGFKGAWLALWLHRLGAEVHGFSLDPPTRPSLYEEARVASLLAADRRGDLRTFEQVLAALEAARPEIVLHLAAQSLVPLSYREPVETYAANVLGTAHLLEAVRRIDTVRAVVVVTSDKCYENREWVFPYRENDPLGGHDPYSSSKACTELVAASYRASFLGVSERLVALATVRAGNVIGGGDWAADRLLPDCMRAFAAGRPVTLRYPQAVRPWQHVLEPLSGYLSLTGRLLSGEAAEYAEAWNFGPDPADNASVGEVARMAAALWGDGARVETPESTQHPHEAGLLRLDATKARVRLGWKPRWRIDEALLRTVDWYRARLSGEDMQAWTLGQIDAYERAGEA